LFAAPSFAQRGTKPEAPVKPVLPRRPAALPITRVALYKNGVGFFEHTGHVQGDEQVTIDFTSAQLNDVLQSLTAIDLGGGRISGAGYNSTTPLEQQLKTLPLALTADPSDVDFYNAIRGARVQVTGVGAAITGRLLSLDLRANLSKTDTDADAPQRRFVTVVADSGAVRTVELTSAVSVTLLDSSLHTDVSRYLELLAANRSEGLRHLTLLDRGTGARELRVNYISEVPVWKSTYRILFTDAPARHSSSCDPPTPATSHQNPDGTFTGSGSVTCHQYDSIPITATDAVLQGWSVVDNTTGSDWINVHLDLIAGAPQSFIQPLSTPYYARRPEVPLPAEAQLAPQTHESGDANELSTELNALASPTKLPKAGQVYTDGFTGGGLEQFAKLSPGVAGMQGMTGGSAGGVMGGIGVGSGNGMGPGSGGNMGGSVTRIGSPVYATVPKPIGPYNQLAQASLNPQTATAAFDDFFEYTLTDPITIRKNESALVPILQTRLPIERVTLWSQQQPVALRALWITNSSTLTLDRGSFAITENGSFGGEGLLDAIHPGEKRLLSYAADQAVRVTTDKSNYTRTVKHIAIKKGVLTESSVDLSEVDYVVHNAAPDARTVIVEQPLMQGWELASETKPAETTPTAYRFRVAAKPGESVHLHIAQRHTSSQGYRLVDRNEDQLLLLFKNDKVSPAFMAKLQPVFDIHHTVVAFDDQIRQRQAETTDIGNDQDRLRKNMAALKGTPEEKALATRYTGELNQQEDRLAAIRKEIEELKVKRQAADTEFQAKLEAIDLDEAM
jgi:hypothetical protein